MIIHTDASSTIWRKHLGFESHRLSNLIGGSDTSSDKSGSYLTQEDK